MTVISFTDRLVGKRFERETAQARLENIKADRALVAVMPPPAARSDAPAYQRPTAFLAHLVAIREDAPQTRERRRAEPAEALAAYQAAMKLVAPNGAQMARDL